MNGKIAEDGYEAKRTVFAVIPAVVCPLAFLFQFGFNIGSLNAIGDELKRFYNQSFQERFNQTITTSEMSLLWPMTTASFSLGGVVGTFLAKFLTSRFGQLRTMFYVQFLCILGTSLLFVSFFIHSHETIIIGEILNGMYCSIGSIVGPIYVRDITIPRLRGTMGGLFGVFIVLGIISGNAFGLKQLLGTDDRWHFLLALNAVPNVIFLSCYRWMPENPRFVYFKTRNEETVLKLLEKLFGTSEVFDFLEEYKTDMRKQANTMTLWEILKSPFTRLQLLSAVVVLISVQITGINGVMYNLNNVLVVAGVDKEIAPYISVSVGAIQLIGSIVMAAFIAPKWGRKTIFFFGNSILAVSCLVYTLSVAFQHSSAWSPYISIVATMTYALGLNTGSSVVAFILAPEVLSQSARSVGMSVAVLCLWLSFVLVSFVTPLFFEFLKFGPMVPYLLIAVLLILYVYFVIPETKNMNGVEIDEYFQQRSRGCCMKSVEKSADPSDDFTESNLMHEPQVDRAEYK